MKNKIYIISSLLICGIVFLGSRQQNNKFNDLSMANIEALAIGEAGDKVGCTSMVKFSPGGWVVYCADCEILQDYVDGTPGTGSGMCTLN